MITHIIYHIDGQKVGCTRNFYRRRREYPVGTEFEILEELHDKTDKEAGDIEWQWSDRLGYKRSKHFELARKAGLVGGLRAAELGKTPFYTMSPEQRRLNGRKAGLRTVELKIGAHGMSSEKHREASRKGGLIGGRKGSGRNGGLRTVERRNGSQYQHSQCPHCGKRGNLPSLSRWHMNNCPSRESENV